MLSFAEIANIVFELFTERELIGPFTSLIECTIVDVL